MGKTTSIYALCEPGTRTVRYIGKTSTTPQKRLKRHLKESVKLDTHLGRWLRKIASCGAAPSLVVFREVPGDGSEAEKRYIRLARGCKMDLVNSTDGGEGLNNPSPETLEKLRKAATGVEKAPSTLAKMSVMWQGEKNPNFGKMGESHPWFGHTHSEESCAAISESKQGEKNPQFGKTGEKSPRFGVLHSDASCKQMSAAKKGNKNPNFGKSYTDAEKAKLSAAATAAHARRKAAKV